LAGFSWRDIDILFDVRDLTDNLPAQVFQVPVDVRMGAAAGIGESLRLLEQPI